MKPNESGSANELPQTDELDARIVERLRADPRVPSSDLAREFSVVSATIGRRIRRLHDEGIAPVVAATPLSSMGADVLVLAFVRVDSAFALSLQNIARAIGQIPEVLVIASLLSSDQLLLWISATDLAHAERLLERKLGQVRGIVSIRSELVTDVGSERTETFARLDPASGARGEQHFLKPLSTLLSDAERMVLAELRVNGRQSVREVARRVGKSQRSVRAAIKAMEEKNLLELRTLVFLPAFGSTQAVLIELDIDHHRRTSIVDALRETREASYVLTTTGRSHRVKVIAHVDSNRALASYLNATVAPMPGVLSARTTPILSGYKHDGSYVLRSLRANDAP